MPSFEMLVWPTQTSVSAFGFLSPSKLRSALLQERIKPIPLAADNWKPDHDPVADRTLIETKDKRHFYVLPLTVAHPIENASTRGDAVVRARISGYLVEPQPTVFSQYALVHARRGFTDRLPRTVIVRDSPAMETTINLDETYPAESGWIIASHLIMRDLMQTFGLAEPFQFDRQGWIRRKYFREAGWTEDYDTVVTDDTV